MSTQLIYHEYSFEKLNVWQNSIDFVKMIYQITDNFPKTEVYGITSQLRRAVVSIPIRIIILKTKISKPNLSIVPLSNLFKIMDYPPKFKELMNPVSSLIVNRLSLIVHH